MSDDLLFAPESESEEIEQKGSWKVLIVDDDYDIHEITKIILRDIEVNDKNIIFSSAYSAKDCSKMYEQGLNFDLIFMDIVMEEDDSGY
ncbi:MAG: hypothetical protein HQL32_07630, partial [Planctomycetes bacterium]|nr:hypothetical protein [Planctomycetota bacterium]